LPIPANFLTEKTADLNWISQRYRFASLSALISDMERLLNGYRELSEASNVPERTLRTLVKNGVLPFIKAGHRTILFSPSKVEKALARRTVKEVVA